MEPRKSADLWLLRTPERHRLSVRVICLPWDEAWPRRDGATAAMAACLPTLDWPADLFDDDPSCLPASSDVRAAG